MSPAKQIGGDFRRFLALFPDGFPVGDADEADARFRWTEVRFPAIFKGDRPLLILPFFLVDSPGPVIKHEIVTPL